jgi:hydroxymethylbilane synthase
MRGNVDTRLRKVAGGEVDAAVLAAAGLHRLGRESEITQTLTPAMMLPAPAQGALAVECRAGDQNLVERLGRINDEHSRVAVAAERTLLATLEAGCSAPVAAFAEIEDTVDGVPRIRLSAGVFAADGSHAVRRSATGALSEAVGLGARVAAQLLADGADLLLGENG